MIRGERRAFAVLGGLSALAVLGALYARADAVRPYRSVPHVSFSSVVARGEDARRGAAEASQEACDSASGRLLGELEQNRIFYAYEGGMEGERFSNAKDSIISELRAACEGASLVPEAIYEPEVITATGGNAE